MFKTILTVVSMMLMYVYFSKINTYIKFFSELATSCWEEDKCQSLISFIKIHYSRILHKSGIFGLNKWASNTESCLFLVLGSIQEVTYQEPYCRRSLLLSWRWWFYHIQLMTAIWATGKTKTQILQGNNGLMMRLLLVIWGMTKY